MATTYSSTAPPRSVDDVSDGHLLDLFIRHKDESAFAELVHRHGRMVLGVCQRVLDNPHDAEDCFQAAFLVLVRKATMIHPREMVGNWLYGVAYRTALEAKKMAARRRNRERKKFDMPRPDADTDRWRELQPLLDQELTRLPEKYRFVLIACDIEGRTRKDVAQSMALPEGTVASRLARARTMLAKRLTRRNLAISTALLATLLSDKASAAFVPATLTASTASTAAQLAAGKSIPGLANANVLALMSAVVKSMLLVKLRIASAVLVVLAVLGLGVGTLLPPAAAHKRPDKQKALVVETKKAKPDLVQDCVLQSVDPVTHRIQAMGSTAAGGGATEIFDLKVEPTTAIIVNGKDGTLADLQVGASANLEMERGADGATTAVRIEVGQEPLEGVVQAFNDNSVTIQTVKQPDGEKYETNRDVSVVVNGKKAKLGDLKIRMRVALQVSVGKQSVFGIKATGPSIDGVVKSFDIDRRTLCLEVDKRLHDIPIAEDAVVAIDGKAGKLADLRAGMQISVRMSAERGCIVGITAGPR